MSTFCGKTASSLTHCAKDNDLMSNGGRTGYYAVAVLAKTGVADLGGYVELTVRLSMPGSGPATSS